jgi:hypothetical protein
MTMTTTTTTTTASQGFVLTARRRLWSGWTTLTRWLVCMVATQTHIMTLVTQATATAATVTTLVCTTKPV